MIKEDESWKMFGSLGMHVHVRHDWSWMKVEDIWFIREIEENKGGKDQ